MKSNWTIIDGTQVLVAVADRVFIYDAATGEMIKQIRGNIDKIKAK